MSIQLEHFLLIENSTHSQGFHKKKFFNDHILEKKDSINVTLEQLDYR